MDIILKILTELFYVVKDDFCVECTIDSQKTAMVNVKLMISEENDSQVFLIVECDDSQLVDYVDGKIIKKIAVKFRKNEYHRAEMDRNTTLLIVCKHEIGKIDLSSKVKIEDDPYYFKKYVFSYDEVGLENAKIWLQENMQRDSRVALIQEYITNTNHFAKYKENHQNESIYTFFMELVTKLHCFPMKPAESENIRSVKEFLDDELELLRNKNRNPIDIDKNKLDSFIEANIDFDNTEEVCSKWKSILMVESEEN